MRNIFKTLFGLAFVCLVCGCIKVSPVESPLSVRSQSPVVRPDDVGEKEGDGEFEVDVLPETASYFYVSVGISGDEEVFGQELVHVVDGALADAGAQIVQNTKADLVFTITPSFKVIDNSGEFYRVDCQVAAKVTSADGTVIYSTNMINYPSSKRQLGLEAAKKQFLPQAAEDCRIWAMEVLASIGEGALGVEAVEFKYPANWSLDVNRYAKRVSRLGTALGQVPGIMSWQLIKDDKENRRCIFRVVYSRESFRSGLANTIAEKIEF